MSFFLRFIEIWSLLFPWCEPQSQHLLLPDLLWLCHISIGQKAAEIWEIVAPCADGASVAAPGFVVTGVRYWWLQGSGPGKQGNALLPLGLPQEPREQILNSPEGH